MKSKQKELNEHPGTGSDPPIGSDWKRVLQNRSIVTLDRSVEALNKRVYSFIIRSQAGLQLYVFWSILYMCSSHNYHALTMHFAKEVKLILHAYQHVQVITIMHEQFFFPKRSNYGKCSFHLETDFSPSFAQFS